MEDGDAVLARFNRLMRDLETGSTNRNSFQAWEVELMLDIASCNLSRSSRRRVLQRYRRAAARLIQMGAAGPLKLSEYLARRASGRGRSALGGCAILESRKAS